MEWQLGGVQRLRPGSRDGWRRRRLASAPQTRRARPSPDLRRARANRSHLRRPNGCHLQRHAVICLTDGDAAGALDALRGVRHSPLLSPRRSPWWSSICSPVSPTVRWGIEAPPLRQPKRSLAVAEPDRLLFPFAMTDAGGPARRGASSPHGSRRCSPTCSICCEADPPGTSIESTFRAGRSQPKRTPGIAVLPTNLTRPEIAGEFYVSVNTVNTHVRSVYSKLYAGWLVRRQARSGAAAALDGAPPTTDVAQPSAPTITTFRRRRAIRSGWSITPWPHRRLVRDPDKGSCGATAVSAFPSMVFQLQRGETVLTGLLEDRSAVFGVLAQIEALGLEVVGSDRSAQDRNRLNQAMTAHGLRVSLARVANRKSSPHATQTDRDPNRWAVSPC